MECKVCNHDYPKSLIKDFVDGVCLPCQVQKQIEEDEAAQEKELNQYNRKYNTSYDSESFYDACFEQNIEIETLKGFPLLRGAYKYSESVREEVEHSYKEYENRQLDLFDDPSLPF